MLRLAAEREGLSVVADQIGAPTSAELIADVTALVLQRLAHDEALAANASGTYHLVAQGETSWHGYAQFITEKAAALGYCSKRTLQQSGLSEPKSIRCRQNAPPTPGSAQTSLGARLGLNCRWEHHAERLLAQIVPGILQSQENLQSARQAAEALAEKRWLPQSTTLTESSLTNERFRETELRVI